MLGLPNARSICGANKTDANDADGLAHLVRADWYKEVRVKSRDAMLSKAVSAARRQLLDISTNLSNQVRGLMRPCLVAPKGKGRIFEVNVRPIPVCPSCGGHAPTAERTVTRQMPDTREAYRIV